MSENDPELKQPTGEGDRRPLLREVAYDRIRTAITEGQISPGETISEQRLSGALGISRTPIREALHQLAKEGLVRLEPGRPATVASLSLSEIGEIVHLRTLLDPEIARLVAELVPHPMLQVLQEATDEMEKATASGDRAAWSEADRKWHRTLIDMCPNRLLGTMALRMRDRIHHVTLDSNTSRCQIVACTSEHRKIVEAIAKGDSRAAEQAMREHIDQLRGRYFHGLI